jgi:cytochrome P450 family 4
LVKIVSQRYHEPIFYIERLYHLTRNYQREKKYRKRCSRYLDQVLKEKREHTVDKNCNNVKHPHDEEMGQPSAESRNLIDYLIFNQESFTDEEIHNHLFSLVFTGFDKIALQTAFTIMLLAMHEETQEKVFNEISAILPSNAVKITERDLESMKYLEIVILESLRLLPSKPLIGRETLEDFELNGKIIPKGKGKLLTFFFKDLIPFFFFFKELLCW